MNETFSAMVYRLQTEWPKAKAYPPIRVLCPTCGEYEVAVGQSFACPKCGK